MELYGVPYDPNQVRRKIIKLPTTIKEALERNPVPKGFTTTFDPHNIIKHVCSLGKVTCIKCGETGYLRRQFGQYETKEGIQTYRYFLSVNHNTRIKKHSCGLGDEEHIHVHLDGKVDIETFPVLV